MYILISATYHTVVYASLLACLRNRPRPIGQTTSTVNTTVPFTIYLLPLCCRPWLQLPRHRSKAGMYWYWPFPMDATVPVCLSLGRGIGPTVCTYVLLLVHIAYIVWLYSNENKFKKNRKNKMRLTKTPFVEKTVASEPCETSANINKNLSFFERGKHC